MPLAYVFPADIGLGRLLSDCVAQAGLRRDCVAGGDTSGQACQALDVSAIAFLTPLAPGSPLCLAHRDDDLPDLEIVLKGGQVGAPEFFEQVRRGADFFGGIAAKQHIVCSLMQAPESAYAKGERISRDMYAPVMRSHRMTVEQMAILEPALSETAAATCVSVVREAMDEAIRRGVPAQAAQDFIEGHLGIEIAILFGHLPGAQFSDTAKRAVENAKRSIF